MIENRIKSVSGRPTENNILSPDDIREIESPISVPIRVLDHVINCRLRAVRTFLEPGVTEALKFAGPSWSDYWYCNQRGQPWDTCLNVLEGSCQQAQHVVAKVLRLSVGAYWTLLFRNNNLKVVHLFRDPRGVVNSRLNTRGYALKKTIENVKTNAEALCDKMWSDLQEGKRLMGKFPDRFKFVHYEKLVYLDKEVIELHDFLGLRLTRANLETIRRDYTNVLWKWRENRQNNAFWWRTSLPWELIKAVDNACGDVLEELGYPVFENFEHMQNMNYTDILYGLKY
ncbi:carbohydrate sulfotransferase 1-like [Dreissena polymorpha]|nr:carbohydrate sulfotransferase 1-like [Dreissena polymorpha]